MSLTRIASVEGFERQRLGSNASTEQRRMSFNPISDWIPPKDVYDRRPSLLNEALMTEEVSKRKRVGKCSC